MRVARFLLAVVCTLQCAHGRESELLPAPTGAHTTGRASFHWKDEARDELETSAPGDKRELIVHVFYPADAKASGERAPYLPDADVMRGLWNAEQLARIESIRAYSLEHAALPSGDARFPVVIFMPGGGMKTLTYHTLCEDLASHGWVVAAIEPTYNPRAVRFPDGRVLGNLAPLERGWPRPQSNEEERRFYEERIAHWSRDISFVIDRLRELDAGDGPFAKRLDLVRGVGVLGHSRGGQAAGAVRILDDRVRAGINLDGMAGDRAILSVKGEEVGAAAFLWIHKSLPPPPSAEQLERVRRTREEYDEEVERIHASWKRQLESVSGGALRVVFDRPGVEHIDFSDEPYWDGITTLEQRPGRVQTISDARAWVRAFFEATIRDQPDALKSLANPPSSTRTQSTVHVYGEKWR